MVSPQKVAAKEFTAAEVENYVNGVCHVFETIGNNFLNAQRCSTPAFVKEFGNDWCTQTVTKNSGLLLTYGRRVYELLYALPMPIRLSYLLLEVAFHSLAVSSQISLSVASLVLTPDKGEITKSVVRSTLKRTFMPSSSWPFGSEK